MKSRSIVIDVDGPLTKNEEWIIHSINITKKVKITKKDIHYDYTIVNGKEIPTLLILTSSYYYDVKPYNASEFLLSLSKNFNIIFATARSPEWSGIPSIYGLTSAWIKKNYGINTPLLIQCRPEERYDLLKATDAIYYIDDCPDTVLSLAGPDSKQINCSILLFDKIYNKHIRYGQRVYNWKNIFDTITKGGNALCLK